jgi:putative oxidoreductase
VSIPLTIILVTALLTAHAKGAMAMFSSPEEFLAQPPVTFLMVTLIVFVFGAGWFSVDYLIRRLVKKSNA